MKDVPLNATESRGPMGKQYVYRNYVNVKKKNCRTNLKKENIQRLSNNKIYTIRSC